MIFGTLKIINLGRGKVNRIVNIEATDESDFNIQLEREFSKHLISRDISFDEGKIFAGFRKVGEFEFIAKEMRV